MSHTPHELHDEFPDAGQILHDLKMSNAHFVKLSDQYHETNREIHRIESEVEAASDERLLAFRVVGHLPATAAMRRAAASCVGDASVSSASPR